jgi:hypothetical protein
MAQQRFAIAAGRFVMVPLPRRRAQVPGLGF